MSATTAGTPTQATPPGEKTITVSIPEHVHRHFAEQAKADYRTLKQFIELKLLGLHKQDTTPAIVSGSSNTTSGEK